MYVVIYIVTVYNSNNVMVDVNLYVTNKVAIEKIKWVRVKSMSVHSYIVKHIIGIHQYTHGHETICNLVCVAIKWKLFAGVMFKCFL